MGGNAYHPLLHKLALIELKKLCDMYKVDASGLSQFKFLQQNKPRGKREYIFLVDVSNPNMSKKDIKDWKKKCRSIAENIFDNLIKPDDRIAIYDFCAELNICFNLAKKQHQVTIMKK